MNKLIMEYFTRENITLGLSIFGAFGTLITFVSTYLTKRKNLKIYFSDVAYKKQLHLLVVPITFENRSQLPIAVTSIACSFNGEEHPLVDYPRCVESYSRREGQEVVDRKFLYNLNFPVTIQQLDAISGRILLELSPKDLEKLSTHLTFQVYSTRGKVQKIILPHDQIKYY